MTGPTKRDIESRLNEFDDDNSGAQTVRINHEYVDEDGVVVERETEVIELGGDS